MTDIYIQMIVNSVCTGIGAAVGNLIGQKFLERTKLRELDIIIEKKLRQMNGKVTP